MQVISGGVRLMRSGRADRPSARLPNGKQQHLKANAIKHAARKNSFSSAKTGASCMLIEADAVPTDERPFKARAVRLISAVEDSTDCGKVILALLLEGISL
jgi:hypothetical protein